MSPLQNFSNCWAVCSAHFQFTVMLESPVSPFVPRSFISQPRNTTVSKLSPGSPGDTILHSWHMLLHACTHSHT